MPIITYVALFVISASHHDLSISDIEEVAKIAHELRDTSNNNVDLDNNTGLDGWVELSTCNRYELYMDSNEQSASDLAERLGPVSLFEGMTAARHIYEVASGLDSMVVGEREIVAQVRAALKTARTAGTTTATLEHVLQSALRTSRKVAVNTAFTESGSSIVGAALDMARAGTCQRPVAPSGSNVDIHPPQLDLSDWSNIRVLLVGTGAYAGATMAALKARGATHVTVWSKSGRAEAFARKHGIDAAEELNLLAPAVVVLCRGTGSPVITEADLRAVMPHRSPLTLIDLARSRDVDTRARHVPGVRLIDLEAVRYHVPAASRGDIERAQTIIDDALSDLYDHHVGREMDPVIVGMRNHIAAHLEREMEQFPASGLIPAEQATHALQRFAASLAHSQFTAARRAARSGKAADYHAAAQLVYGTNFPQPRQSGLTLTQPDESAQPTAERGTHD